MTGGGPGDSTETLAMYIHKTTLDFLDFGYGSALAALMFVLSMAVTSGYLRYTRRSARPRATREPMTFNRRAVVWFAAIVVVVNGFFPAVWILLTSLKTETELLRVPITFLPGRADVGELRDRVHRPADPPLHVEQPRRRLAVDGALRVRRRARRLRADASADAAAQPDPDAAARGRDVPA